MYIFKITKHLFHRLTRTTTDRPTGGKILQTQCLRNPPEIRFWIKIKICEVQYSFVCKQIIQVLFFLNTVFKQFAPWQFPLRDYTCSRNRLFKFIHLCNRRILYLMRDSFKSGNDRSSVEGRSGKEASEIQRLWNVLKMHEDD